MFRFRDGTPIPQELHDLAKIKVLELFENDLFLQKWNFKREDKEAISKFLFLLKNQEKEFKENDITRIYQNLMREGYEKREKEKSDLTPFEKSIKTRTRNKFISVQLGDADPKKFKKRSIFLKIAHSLLRSDVVQGRTDDLERNVMGLTKALEHKHGHIVQNEMRNIRAGYHTFKNSHPVKALLERVSHPVYKDKIDTDRLLRYVFATPKLKATKSDMKWLYGVLKIVTNNGNYSRREEKEKARFETIKNELMTKKGIEFLYKIEHDLPIEDELLMELLDEEEEDFD